MVSRYSGRTLKVFLLPILAAPLLAQGQDSFNKLRVGVITPLSGSAQMYGTAVRNGIELALSEIKNPALEVLYEDDGFVISKSVAAFKKLSETDAVNLVISTASSPSNAIAPLAEKAKVPLLAWASDSKVSKDRAYVVRSWMSGYEEGKRIAAEAAARRYAKVAHVVSINDYPLSVRDGFINNFPAAQVVLDEEFPPDTTDFKAFLAKARKDEASGIALCLNPGASALLAKQARELGVSAAFFGCENLHSKDEVAASQNALVGAWFVTAGVSEEFKEKYIKRFADDSVVSGAAIHYDIIKLLNEIAEEQPANGADLISRLYAGGVRQGAVGTYEVRKVDGDQYFHLKLVVREIIASGFKDIG